MSLIVSITKVLWLVSIPLLIIFQITCSGTNQMGKTLFPPNEACNYPTKSSIAKFHQLGGGTWRHLVVGDADLGYDCGKSEKQIPLIASGNDDAYLEYGVVGTAEGATSVGFDYSINTKLSSEPEQRKDFVALLDEVSRQALKEPLPESVKAKIIDLNTFANLGVINVEKLPVGEGQIEFSRNKNSDNTAILVKVAICADNKVRCE